MQRFEISTIESMQTLKEELIALLVDCVDSGASVGFIPPLEKADAIRYWDSVESEILDKSKKLIVAIKDNKVLGAVQLAITKKQNGNHRGEVQKLMVHANARGKGIARKLMAAIEAWAINSGRHLLVLDTRKDDVAATLYRKIGYIEAGQIPGYARSASGDLHTTCFFYKQL